MDELLEVVVAFKLLLWTVRNLLIILSVWSFIEIVGHIIPNSWREDYHGHVAIAISLAACMSAMWVSGLQPLSMEGDAQVAGIDGHEIGFRIALGVLLTLGTLLCPVAVRYLSGRFLPEKVAKGIRKILL